MLNILKMLFYYTPVGIEDKQGHHRHIDNQFNSLLQTKILCVNLPAPSPSFVFMSIDPKTDVEETHSVRSAVILISMIILAILFSVSFPVITFIVDCGKTYPSVSHTLTFSNIPQTAWSCAQTTGRGRGERCLKAHPEARKTFGPNGYEKDKGDCLYDYPEVGFQKAGFYLENQTSNTQ